MKIDGRCGLAEIALWRGGQGVAQALKGEEESHHPEGQVDPENRQQLLVLLAE